MVIYEIKKFLEKNTGIPAYAESLPENSEKCFCVTEYASDVNCGYVRRHIQVQARGEDYRSAYDIARAAYWLLDSGDEKEIALLSGATFIGRPSAEPVLTGYDDNRNAIFTFNAVVHALGIEEELDG